MTEAEFSGALAHPELIHPRKRVGMRLLELMPASEIGERAVRGVASAIAGGRRAAIGELEPEEGEVEALQLGSDLRQREAALLDMEEQVATAAQAVEVLTARDTGEVGILGAGADCGAAGPAPGRRGSARRTRAARAAGR